MKYKFELSLITAEHKNKLMHILVALLADKVFHHTDPYLEQFIKTVNDAICKKNPLCALCKLSIESKLSDIKEKAEKKNNKSAYELREEADRKEITDWIANRQAQIDFWTEVLEERAKAERKRLGNKFKAGIQFKYKYILLENLTGSNFLTDTLDTLTGGINSLWNTDGIFRDVILWTSKSTRIKADSRPNKKYLGVFSLYEDKYNQACRWKKDKMLSYQANLIIEPNGEITYKQSFAWKQINYRHMLEHYGQYYPVFVCKRYQISMALAVARKYETVVGFVVVADDYSEFTFYKTYEELYSDNKFEKAESGKDKYELESIFEHQFDDDTFEYTLNNFDMSEYSDVARPKGQGNLNNFGRYYEFPTYAGTKIQYKPVYYNKPGERTVERMSYTESDAGTTLEGISFMSDNYQKYVKENYSSAPRGIRNITNAYKISAKPEDFRTGGNVFCPCCKEEGRKVLLYWSLTELTSVCRVCGNKIPNPVVIIDRDVYINADVDIDRQNMVDAYYIEHGSFDPKFVDVRSTPWDLNDAKDDKDGSDYTDNVVVDGDVVGCNESNTIDGVVGSFEDRVVDLEYRCWLEDRIRTGNRAKFRKPHACFVDGSKTIIFRK